jgi:hypothetical protein
VVELERCPYDSSAISIDPAGDGYVISCGACGAAWEMHGSSLHRLRAPDAKTLAAVREHLFPREILAGRRGTVAETADHAAR